MKANRLYILNDKGKPIPCHDLFEWAKWFGEVENRRVAETTVDYLWISTVFLGLDHSYFDDGEPILWETMVFTKGKISEQRRCGGSREQAEAMHAATVAEFIPGHCDDCDPSFTDCWNDSRKCRKQPKTVD